MITYRAVLILTLLLSVAWVFPRDGSAIPPFARKYRVSCTMCHTAPPKLNAFGETFAGNGFEFVPGEPPRDSITTGDPLLRLLQRIDFGVRLDAYGQVTTSSSGGVSNDFQTPYGIKLLSGGPIADRVSYYMYFYMSERGEIAGLEDAYIQFTDLARSGISVMVGQFQASDPLMKRELRLEFEDYQAYRVRVGDSRADLTYDRGLMAFGSPWDGADVSALIVNGRGLSAADDDRSFDRDSWKNAALRISQEFGPLRIGGYGYFGREKDNGVEDEILIFGPDASLTFGNHEINAQYLRRSDDNPFFTAAGASSDVDAGLVELIFSPQGPTGRLFLSALYNHISSDDQVVSLRLGEQENEIPFLSEYRTLAGSASYLFRRNIRMLGEVMWDFDQERAKLTGGFMAAF